MRADHTLLLLLMLNPLCSIAGEPEALEGPSLALLEFLGEWQDGEGNEIDPQLLALMQPDEMSSGGERDDEK